MSIEEENIFKEHCKKHLPPIVLIGGIHCNVYYHALLFGGYRMGYGYDDVDGKYHRVFDLFYKIVDVIPENKENTDMFSDPFIYKTSLDEIIKDVYNRICYIEK